MFHGHMFLQSRKTSTWPPVGKITVVCVLSSSVERFTTLCTHKVHTKYTQSAIDK